VGNADPRDHRRHSGCDRSGAGHPSMDQIIAGRLSGSLTSVSPAARRIGTGSSIFK
jgi:hypothetical protein